MHELLISAALGTRFFDHKDTCEEGGTSLNIFSLRIAQLYH